MHHLQYRHPDPARRTARPRVPVWWVLVRHHADRAPPARMFGAPQEVPGVRRAHPDPRGDRGVRPRPGVAGPQQVWILPGLHRPPLPPRPRLGFSESIHPGAPLPTKPPTYRPPRQQRPSDSRASSRDRGYTHHWESARLSHLAEHPLCAECLAEGRVVEATVVDHIRPHKRDRELFWDRSNWQSLCEPHHNRKTATRDGGFGRAPTGE